MRPDKAPLVIKSDAPAVQEKALGGGLEGAQRNSRELALWSTPIVSPDRQINPVKDTADARALSSVQNDGLTMGVIHTNRDSIVGDQFTLICTPDYELLGADEGWADEFAQIVEAEFNLAAESDECWFDAGGMMTLTEMIRLDMAIAVIHGETLTTVEWDKDTPGRPFKTCFQAISPTRLSNPNGEPDTETLRAGVVRNRFGAPQGYWIRVGFPGDMFNPVKYPEWKYVAARKPWGRRQVIHIREALRPDQTRGIADMVAALKEMRMTSRFKEITLQQAVVNATYATAIESDLPPEVVFAAMGAGGQGMSGMLAEYMGALKGYVDGADNVAIDGVKLPHLFPGTKLNLKNAGTPGGVGTPFEESLLRGIAACLGQSYEEFSRDFSKANYSNARASMSKTWANMKGKKKVYADRKADAMYTAWAEEMINAGRLPLPKGFTLDTWYNDPIKREALLSCAWVGAGRGQIDEVKETQAAVMRINSGLSDRRTESALLGRDFRKVFRQLAREQRMAQTLGLNFSAEATKPGVNDRQDTMKENKDE